MSNLKDEFWNICWPGSDGNEIGLEGYECSEPWDCRCLAVERSGGGRIRCGYTLADARSEIIKHYRGRADYLEGLSDKEFLEWFGYYGAQGD